MSAPKQRPYLERSHQGVVICRGYRRTWSFPTEVSELLQEQTRGQSVLQLFGGRAAWGLRLDADRATKPHVVANAFYPPFRCGSFDAVILDPPYARAGNSVWMQVFVPAACLSRSRIWWFSTDCLKPTIDGLRLLRWWLVVTSDHGPPRYLSEIERVRHPKRGCHIVGAFKKPIRYWERWSHVQQPNLDLGDRVRGAGGGR